MRFTRYTLYWQFNLVCLLLIQAAYLPSLSSGTMFYAAAAIVSQTTLLLVILSVFFGLMRRIGMKNRALTLMHWILFTALLLLILADLQLYRMYGFHINGFVINLVLTPGGIESLGSSTATLLTYGAMAFSVALLQGLLMLGSLRAQPRNRWYKLTSPRKRGLLLLAMVVLVDKAAYGVASFTGEKKILLTANSLPAYVTVTFRSTLLKLGFNQRSRGPSFAGNTALSSLAYPRNPLTVSQSSGFNIVWLTAETLRADMLTPEIMPRTWAFAKERGITFQHHYSGGNGTRMGMFSQFYGLPGRYWFNFLEERKPAAIMEVLQQQQYDIRLYSGAKFSYPEFDKTMFASVPSQQMQDNASGNLGNTGWQADRKNVDSLISNLDDLLPTQQFMRFVFFESAHARYYFPPESVIREPYLPSVNYATMNLERDKTLLLNRYVNSVHHLDSQIGRVLDALERKNLLDSTIVIITGDHGEAFMEHGQWGHNSEFTDEQTRVPLVVAIPGEPARSVARLTSHVDLVPTLMPLLGVENPRQDYSTGTDLLGTSSSPYVIISDWERVCLVTDEFKLYRAVNPRAWFYQLGHH